MEIHRQTARTDPARARRIINHMQLFGHPGLAQSLVPSYRASFQVGDERCASLLGATEERVGRREESV
jgi:hypothetical protein